MAPEATPSTEPITHDDDVMMDSEEDDEEWEDEEGDFDLCPTFLTAEIPTECLNFVLESVSHGFGLDFIDDNDVFCDHCADLIFGKYYHCDICNNGDFDICPQCKEKGEHCEVKAHELEECGAELDDDEVDEAIRSDEEKDEEKLAAPNAKKSGHAHGHGHEHGPGCSHDHGDDEEDEDAWEEVDDGELDGESPLYIVDTRDPDAAAIKLRSRAPVEEAVKSPFLGESPEQVYAFWKEKLQRAQDVACANNMSAFTFAILDEETVRSFEACTPKKVDGAEEEDEDEEKLMERMEKTTMLVCTDAPDFGEAEGEIKLKTVRMSLRAAATAIMAFELLAVCPSEFGKENPLDVMPPPTLDMENVPEGEEDGKMTTLGGLVGVIGKPAAPNKARDNKRKAIAKAEAERK